MSSFLKLLFSFALSCTVLTACTNTSPWVTEQPQVTLESTPVAELGPLEQTAVEAMTLAQAQELRIGMLAPLTGPQGALGASLLNAAQLAIDDSAGGMNVVLLPQDTASDPLQARAAMQRLQAQGAQIILGPLFAKNVRAISPMAIAANQPVLAFSTDSTVAGQGTYIMGFLPETQVKRVMQAAQSKGLTRFAVYGDNTPYSQTVARAAQGLVPTTQIALYDQGGAGIAAAALQQSRPQAILIPLSGQTLYTALNTLKAVGLTQQNNVQYLGTGVWDDGQVARIPDLKGAWYAASDSRLRQNFETNYRSVFATTPPRLATLAYDAAALAIVLAKQDQLQGRNVDYTMSDLTAASGFAGVDGIFRLLPNGQIDRDLTVVTVGK